MALNDNFFALELIGISDSTVQVNCVDEPEFFLNVKQGSGAQAKTTTVKVSGSLLNIKVNKRIGKHNRITTTLKLVEKGDNSVLNISKLKDTFSNVETVLKVQSQTQQPDSVDPTKTAVVNTDLFTVAEKYFILSVAPRYNKTNGTFYVDLAIYSQDIFLDMTKYSKAYTARRLGEYILPNIISSHTGQQMAYYAKDMRVLRCKPLDDSGQEMSEIELLLPYVVQYNETEWNFLLRNANRCGEFLYFENGQLNLGLTRIYEPKANDTDADVERVKDIVDSDYSSIESLFDYQSANTATCFYNNAINSSVASATPYVAEYSNDDCFDTFTDKSNDNHDDCKKKLFFPSWSRVLSRLFQYKTLMSFGVSNMVGELIVDNAANMISDSSLAQIKAVHFPADTTKKDNQYSQVDSETTGYAEFSDYYTEEGRTDKSKVGKIPASYRPNSDIFYAMREAEEAMAREQYRITFDDKQKEFNLGDLVTVRDISSDDKYVVVDVQSSYETIEQEMVNRMVVTIIPVRNNAPVPLPAETEPIRVVGAQTAVVVDNNDPQRLFRVRVKFSWQNDAETTPWIRVTTPFATSDGSGFYSKPNKGDEVMVDFEYGNIERPYVVGSLFNNTHKPPYGLRKYSTAFRSNNGHTIAFNDAKDENSIFATLFPGLNILKMIPGVMTGTMSVTQDKDVQRALGGIEICDYYGLYSISASSDQRRIKIDSPFGTIDMSAAMGINIKSTNGDITISGKNVTIEAGNNLTLKSGTNIGTSLTSLTSKSNRMAVLQAEVMTALGFVGGLFDIPALRFVIDLLIKPINGTLTIHSGRYLLMEAGNGKAQLPEGQFKNCQGDMDYYMVFPQTTIAGKNGKKLNSKDAAMLLIQEISTFVAQFSNYELLVKDNHGEIMRKKRALKELMTGKWKETGKEDEIEKMIVGWMTDSKQLTDDDIKKALKLGTGECKLKPQYRKVYNDDDKVSELFTEKDVTSEVASEIKEVANKLTNLCELFLFNYFGDKYQADFTSSKIDKTLNSYETAKKLFSDSITVDNIYDDDIPYAGGHNSFMCIVRQYVWTLLDTAMKCSIVMFVPDGKTKIWSKPTDWADNAKWTTLIDRLSIAMRNSWEIKSWAVGLRKTVNNMVPLDTFSSLTWKPDATGDIIMSQSKGSSIKIDGDTFKRSSAPPFSKMIAGAMHQYLIPKEQSKK